MSWRDNAACAGAPADLWFPDHDRVIERQAKLICSSCPVRSECLEEALAEGERFGIRGGMTPQERTRYQKGLPAPRRGRPKVIRHGQAESYQSCNRRPEGACQLCKDAHARFKNPEQRGIRGPVKGGEWSRVDQPPMLSARLAALDGVA